MPERSDEVAFKRSVDCALRNWYGRLVTRSNNNAKVRQRQGTRECTEFDDGVLIVSRQRMGKFELQLERSIKKRRTSILEYSTWNILQSSKPWPLCTNASTTFDRTLSSSCSCDVSTTSIELSQRTTALMANTERETVTVAHDHTHIHKLHQRMTNEE